MKTQKTFPVIPKHKKEATDDIREKEERGQKNGRSIQIIPNHLVRATDNIFIL
ncbi:hypothetical protein [Pseudanabaena sp. lw0831]|uniref:hypothetical protein n=1 Tax=Pseudanabaena sp. lw0831 TaxID=1357935 RepID=UPI001915F6D4|nr:hypothetical protein [Pseudanabaena sp. lw0831]